MSSLRHLTRPFASFRSTSLSGTAARRYISTPPSASDGEQVIYDKLKAKFGGSTLEVEDVSGGCGSFYSITLSSPLFTGLSTIKQHRLVNDCLKEEVKGIHGLQIKTIIEEKTS